MPLYRWDGTLLRDVGSVVKNTVTFSSSYTAVAGSGGNSAWDWSGSNLPWAYGSSSQFTAAWPVTPTIVTLQTGGADFYTNLKNTVTAAGARCVVRLPAGTFTLTSLRMIGASGDVGYSFGAWFSNLQGFLGAGPDKTFVRLNATQVLGTDGSDQTSAFYSKLSGMTQASFAPLQAGLMRFDGTDASPILLAGLSFDGIDMANLTQVASDVPAVMPQSAPHQGVVLYTGSTAYVSYVRFRGAGRALTSQPPFEMANLTTQRGKTYVDHCEFDGRLATDVNSGQPRRCGPLMGNNETAHQITDSWLHHSNVSRYAMNDQNAATSGPYTLTRVKSEQISNTHNDNMGGGTNASNFGWESSNSPITLTDCIISQDDPYTDGQIAQHLQFTSVGSRNPQGGRLTVTRGDFRNTGFPSVDGYLCVRAVSGTYWVSDGYATTMTVSSASGTLQPYVYSGTWPPSLSQLSAAGVSPTTHYIVRNS